MKICTSYLHVINLEMHNKVHPKNEIESAARATENLGLHIYIYV